MAPSLTWQRDFSQHHRAGPTSCVFHCSVSHTKPDIHTPTVTAEHDPVISKAERSSCSQVCRSCLTGCWVGGFAVVEPVARKGAGSKVTAGRGGKSCLVYSQPLHNTSWYTWEAKSRHVLTNPHRTLCNDAKTRKKNRPKMSRTCYLEIHECEKKNSLFQKSNLAGNRIQMKCLVNILV